MTAITIKLTPFILTEYADREVFRDESSDMGVIPGIRSLPLNKPATVTVSEDVAWSMYDDAAFMCDRDGTYGKDNRDAGDTYALSAYRAYKALAAQIKRALDDVVELGLEAEADE